MKSLFFVVQGMFEKSDSIGYDCYYQYKVAKQHLGHEVDVRIFAERSDPTRYPDINIESAQHLFSLSLDESTTVVYHFCDGWPALEDYLSSSRCIAVVRWHNNTPPWFFAKYSTVPVKRTIAGLQRISMLGSLGRFTFACNSEYTRRQLRILGVDRGILPVVYPSSRYLNSSERRQQNGTRIPFGSRSVVTLIFVGRVVAHKGHKHVLRVAGELLALCNLPVRVIFPGRSDESAQSYCDELWTLAIRLGVELLLPGEVSEDQLREIYDEADVFVCMSEHEGFGLPVYEAMSRGIPAVTLSITAFTEILHDHPLIVKEIDYADIAFRISRLKDQVFVSKVIRYQNEEVLPAYTNEVVSAQVLRMLQAAQTKEFLRKPNNPKLEVFVEATDNFVTLHDLSAYSSILNDPMYTGLAGKWTAQLVDIKNFFGRNGRLEVPQLYLGDATPGVFIVFGPYLQLDDGLYRASFSLAYYRRVNHQLTGARDEGSKAVAIDVNAGEVLVREQISLVDLIDRQSLLSVDFELHALTSRIEFRVQAIDDLSNLDGGLLFGGLHLERINHPFNKCSVVGPRPVDVLPKMTEPDPFIGPGRRIVMINELVKITDEDAFLESCYNAVLGRPIDESGRAAYRNALRSMSREGIIRDLARSTEGRIRGELYLVESL